MDPYSTDEKAQVKLQEENLPTLKTPPNFGADRTRIVGFHLPFRDSLQ